MPTSFYLSNTDQQYRIASWNGTKWVDREVAFAGTRLYDKEASYTGLIALDPEDPTHIVISTDVNPSTGEALGGKHQIFRAHIAPTGNTGSVRWERLTHDDPRHNIRPMIVSGDGQKAILWSRGQYNTYVDYYLDTVGIVY